MKHAREDYNRIQDPANKIAKDEPVFLVRAQDKSMLVILETWIDEARKNKVDSKMIDLVINHKKSVIEWQEKNGCKTPDL